jgi:hypothetical protein
MRWLGRALAAADERKHYIGRRLLRARDKDRSAKRRGDVVGLACTAAEDKPELPTRATAINPSYAFAYHVKSAVSLWGEKECPEALAVAETEVALDPKSA